MQQGVNISSELANCQTKKEFSFWDSSFNDWLVLVRGAMRDMGFDTDAVEFARAGEYAEPITGIRDFRNEQEERYRVLEKHQKKLAEYVDKRLS
jgi:hypothetical protein